jgi:hypothetical protein
MVVEWIVGEQHWSILPVPLIGRKPKGFTRQPFIGGTVVLFQLVHEGIAIKYVRR